MANSIHRGPLGNQPRTINRRVAAGYLPGQCVIDDGSVLTETAASDHQKRIFVLGNLDFKDQGVETRYAAGDSAVAYELLPGECYQARLANGTYAVNEALSLGGNGRLAKAGTGERVIAWFTGTAGAVAADELGDVTIANGFIKA